MFDYFTDVNQICTQCPSQASCSGDPSLYTLQEILLYQMKQVAYYLFSLKDLGVEDNESECEILRMLSTVVVSGNFKRDEFKRILIEISKKRSELEALYRITCKEKGASCQILDSDFVIDETFNFLDALKQGEQYLNKKNVNLSKTVKDLYEIMFQLLKSASLNLVSLREYDEDFLPAQSAIIKLLSSLNFTHSTQDKLISRIQKFAKINLQLIDILRLAIEKRYGEITKTEVSFDIKPGKSILVTGGLLKDLERVLEATKDKDINVYTHDALILAHSRKFFKQYPHLVGHYQRSFNNPVIDFSSFNGAILMSKYSSYEPEALTRGRVFTTNTISGAGIVKIIDDNFEPLVESALSGHGFDFPQIVGSIPIGYDYNEIMATIDSVIEKINSKTIKHLFLVGVQNHVAHDISYFEELFKDIPKDCIAVLQSHYKNSKNKENIIDLNSSYYDVSLVYNFLQYAKKKIINEKFPITMFMTKCNIHTIAHIFNLIEINLHKNLYMAPCFRDILSPSMIETLRDLFNVHQISESAKADLEIILKQ